MDGRLVRGGRLDGWEDVKIGVLTLVGCAQGRLCAVLRGGGRRVELGLGLWKVLRAVRRGC